MALRLDLIIIRNYKIMAPHGFETGSAFIVYVLPDPVWPQAYFNVHISMFNFLFIFEFNNLFHENEDRFVLLRKLKWIFGLCWLFPLSWEFWQQHIIQSSFLSRFSHIWNNQCWEYQQFDIFRVRIIWQGWFLLLLLPFIFYL